ncbi:hypothetical protein [Trichoplusia ni ascovirus 2c]|uniref:hypothetical protein n=1 Tax=Trichoplusia ni ascovirus 2c TaxID=328615 RepID=UPI0000E4423B|nr:hypothetical protein TNAV2c_gp099 [Trichoplusia ni ascovirus 2c]ABF70616.1 hypothetical protein [Trichoplusia ni ascovirus 2c]
MNNHQTKINKEQADDGAIWTKASCFIKYIYEESLQLQKPEVEEGALQCNRCNSHKIHCTARQVRGGDEPMTVFAICSNCGKRWTQ